MWKQSLSDISCRKVIAIIFVYNFDMGQLSFTVNVVSNRFRSYYSLDKKYVLTNYRTSLYIDDIEISFILRTGNQMMYTKMGRSNKITDNIFFS